MMNRNTWMVGSAAFTLVVMVILAGVFYDDIKGQSEIPDGAIRVSIASSSTKKEWMDAAIKDFNDRSRHGNELRVGGKPIYIEVLTEEIDQGVFDHYRSGTMVSDTLSGKITPTVLSPAEASWVEQLNDSWQSSRGKVLTTGKPTPLVRTPLVVAMWESRAVALGCWPEPGPACTWQELNALAADPTGWGKFGRPDWGHLKIGYGYVGESNSGTLTALLLCSIGANKTSELTVSDIEPTNGCGRAIETFEGAKVHSGKKSSWLLGLMRDGGPDYLDAVTTYEQEVVAFNRENGATLRERLVAIYPQDGTAIAEHPFAILSGADWVSPQQAAAANLFLKYLLGDSQQEALDQWGLRRADAGARTRAPIEPRFGANPNAPIVLIEVPPPLVMSRLVEVWHRVKKHAVIAMVFDKSGSMEGQKMTVALAGAAAFIEAMDPQDELIWIPFDDRPYTLQQGPKSMIGEVLLGRLKSTSAAGGTSLYDAVGQAHGLVQARRSVLGDSRRYGIVVLSDGKDTSSEKFSLAQLRSLLAPFEGDPFAIQIHTIGIGNDADKGVLTTIAEGAHGRYWDAKDPTRALASYGEIAVHY
jgi:Ca-activated chloride channel family protein